MSHLHWLFRTFLYRHPSTKGLIALALAAGLGLVVIAENDRSSLAFAAGWLTAISGFFLFWTARPLFAAASGIAALVLSAGASAAKYKHMAVNAHMVDLY